ncbi:H-2 class II histocompatibility antigen gamma chain-like isoform X2 [Argiope bruennichi]|nr:H-2 class II histocompatibility antigen gamma chain-like isoform X2 [Argiope bruennichi]XP_055953406.1 H-2 class II histocompatibility antigen gamma chain-like isoform X2 [Argiope bruennichi]
MMRQLFLLVLALIVLTQTTHGASRCEMERKFELENVRPGRFVPRCTANGDYRKDQCNGSTGYCFCVDPKTGERVGQAKRGRVHCN